MHVKAWMRLQSCWFRPPSKIIAIDSTMPIGASRHRLCQLMDTLHRWNEPRIFGDLHKDFAVKRENGLEEILAPKSHSRRTEIKTVGLVRQCWFYLETVPDPWWKGCTVVRSDYHMSWRDARLHFNMLQGVIYCWRLHRNVNSSMIHNVPQSSKTSFKSHLPKDTSCQNDTLGYSNKLLVPSG